MKWRNVRFITITVAFAAVFTSVHGINITYDPPRIEELFVGDEVNVTVSLHGDRRLDLENDSVRLNAGPAFNLEASFVSRSWHCDDFVCNSTIKVTGRFLGFGRITISLNDSLLDARSPGKWTTLDPPLEVTILRQDTIMNKLFTIFVATVVTINYINFGCALDLEVVKEVVKRPIGPAVGFVCQFVVMPLVSYGAGYFLFTNPVLRLGLFTFGCSPGGGASNMWTVLLGGNLNLSITMTFISTIAAFGTLPLWLFTLGRTIIQDTEIVVPYSNIMASLVCLVIPIVVGLLIQRYFPKVAARSKRLLAPICIVLLIGIIVLAAIANTYIFFLLSWQMIIAASISVWTGFAAGILVSMAFRFPQSDVVAVSIETGIQNTGIAFLLLSYSLKHPVSDMASVVPVAGSMITPIPLFLVLCVKKIRACCFRSDKMELKTLNSKKDAYQSTKSAVEDSKEQGRELKDVKSY